MRVDRILHLAGTSPVPEWSGPPGISFSEALVAALLDEFTEPGDVVIDPFLGYGTTMVVADRLGRRGIGVELLDERVDHVRGLVARPADVHRGDARRLSELGLATADAALSSPPYMTRTDHPEDPLDGYRSTGADYGRYLDELVAVYSAVAGLVRPGGAVLIDVATLAVDGVVTDVAGDLATAIGERSRALDVVEAIGVEGEDPASWMVADIVLVCRATGAPPAPDRPSVTDPA